jgi:restriction endonuclease S subunit
MRENWEIKKFSDCLQKVSNTAKIPKKKFLFEGSYPIVSQEASFVNGYWDNKDDLLIVDKPIVVFGDHTKVIKYVDFSFVRGADGVKVLLPISQINSKFFSYQLRSIKLRDLGYARHFRLLKEKSIQIPPVQEQEKIVEILDQAFESIEKAKANIEKNIENAKELFQSKLNLIFSQAGEGWEETNIGEIGKVSMCKRILKHQTSQTGEIPFYKIGTFGKEPNAYINAETFNLFKEKYSYPKIGDILLSASGTIGRRVIFDGKPAYFQDSNIVWIDNNEEIILNKYLYHFYEFCDWNPSKGATIKRLYNDDLRRIKISYPTCLEKQKEIIEVIEILDNHIQSLLTSYEEELKNLEELKKSILQKAFSGELTNKNKAA